MSMEMCSLKKDKGTGPGQSVGHGLKKSGKLMRNSSGHPTMSSLGGATGRTASVRSGWLGSSGT
jgi:hypothetical protein